MNLPPREARRRRQGYRPGAVPVSDRRYVPVHILPPAELSEKSPSPDPTSGRDRLLDLLDGDDLTLAQRATIRDWLDS